jgi:hypothetical protein
LGKQLRQMLAARLDGYEMISEIRGIGPRIAHHCGKVIISATTHFQMRPLGRAFR